MNERRRTQRSELSSRLIIKQIDGSGNAEVSIQVEDISKTGIGFTSIEALTIGAVYEGYLTIWTKEVIHAFIDGAVTKSLSVSPVSDVPAANAS